MRAPLWRLCLLGIGLLAGCADATAPQGEPVSPAQRAAADPELCAEHGVMASVCPKCNPRLAAVFQANGDWCDEHGFPESFCPICAPERGGRPVVQPSTPDGAPADGMVVRFRARSVAAQAGLELATAEETGWVSGTEAVARLTWDAARVSVVSARAAGVVQAVHAEVGDRVGRGQRLAEVQSAHVAGDRSRLVAASQARDVAAAEVARKHDLRDGGVSSEREVLAAEAALADAEAALAAVRAELSLVGAGSGDRVYLDAPIDGVVTARRVQAGQSVGALQPAFEVADPSRLWAVLEVPERELAVIQLGQATTLRLDVLPDRVFTGEIAAIAAAVDPLTRTATARVAVENPDGLLRANQLGTVTIHTDTAEQAVVVPAAAVQRAGEHHLVFVQQAVDTYITRRVRVLARQGDRVRVAGGVSAGDAVVTTGSFLLKTETLRDSIGAGCCDVE